MPDDLDRIVGLFCGQLGYQRVLEEVSLNPTRAELHASLSDWLTSPERTADRCGGHLLSGHGLTSAGRHYLLTRDYLDRNPAGTALATEELVWMLGEHSAVQHLLVLIDTCYAGRGALNMGRVTAHVAELRAQTATAGSAGGP